MTNLPSVPITIAQVLRITGNENESVDQLGVVIESDNALTSRLLRIANSAFYGMQEEIYTVRDAIILIGFDAVQSLAISAEVIKGVWSDDEIFDAKKMWEHSLRCALFAEVITRKLRTHKPEVVFTLGVLHDVGRAIMIQLMTEQFIRANTLARTERKFLWKAEQEVFGFHHGDVGSRLVDNWKLPKAYSTAIRYHHEPEQAESEKELTYILTLADSASHYAFRKPDDKLVFPPLYKELWEPLGLDEAAIRDVLAQKSIVEEKTNSFFQAVMFDKK